MTENGKGKGKRNKGQGKRDGAGTAPDPRTFRDHRFGTREATMMFFRWHGDDPDYKGNDAGIAMPALDESVSASPDSGGMVYTVFPDGLVYGDQRWRFSGMGLFLLAILAFFASIHLIIGGTNPFLSFFSTMTDGGTLMFILSLFMVVALLAFSPLMLLMIAEDLIDFRFETSALFDRKAGKVHLFSLRPARRAPWGYRIDSYDWACVRAGIGSVSVAGEQSTQFDFGVTCLVMDAPEGTTIVNRFLLRATNREDHLQPLLDTWEHVRRFMQYEGPTFAHGDGPNFALGRKPLWKHLWTLPEQHMDLTVKMVNAAWREKNPLYLFPAFLGLLTMPGQALVLWWGLLPWFSGLVKPDPVWPRDVLASVGGKALRYAAPNQPDAPGQ
ncbi:DUF6708 domain-containing protein [Massilia rubra]|uniref:DUF6708 domain-containing protein n=1 Tax=Massilia rubra TaxID=2607910 RepID=A0ABX0LPH5_9BURK|nr:DUF6708 domain-containing protein [Massilia rubra]NHZ36778.1 hypothetical protein [Massilia rubra]